MIRKLVLGTVLYFFREAKGYSRKELASECGWTDKRIDKYERGETEPSLDSLECIASKLEISPGDLLRGRDAWLSLLVKIGFIEPDQGLEEPKIRIDEVAEPTTLLPGDLLEKWHRLLADEEALRRRQGEIARRRDELQHEIWAELGSRRQVPAPPAS